MKNSKSFLIYLAILSMLGFLTTDMYLPAFPAMQKDLNTSIGLISASLSIFLAGFACSQIFWGMISDNIGVKPALLSGLIIFFFSCVSMMWVESPMMMLGLRFLQAVGVCAPAVIWQALVVNCFSKQQASKIFATIMPLVALSPAIAPIIGAYISDYFSWRAIFLVLATLAALLLYCTQKILHSPEKKSSSKNNQSLLKFLCHPNYMGNVLVYAACSSSFFAWLTGSPFILVKLNFSSQDIGFSYFPQTLAFLIGGYSLRILLNKKKGDYLLPYLIFIYFSSITTLAIVAYLRCSNILLLLLPFCVMAFANGAIYPIVVSKALSHFSSDTGKASAVQNTFQLGFCFLASLLVSTNLETPLQTTTSIMFATSLFAVCGYFLQKHCSQE